MLQLLWILGVAPSGTANATHFHADFQAARLETAWGAGRWSGEEDLSATCRLRSDGQKIHLEARVIDDVLVVSGDPIHSDHVEVWFDLLGEETLLFRGAGISDHLLRFSRDAHSRPLSRDETR